MSAAPAVTPEELRRALEVVRSKRVAIQLVAGSCGDDLRGALRRIPAELRARLAGVYLFGDVDGEEPVEVPPLETFVTPPDGGYGRNQKLGYLHAIGRGYDVIVVLPADGRCDPEMLPRLLAPFADDDVAAVFGCRRLPLHRRAIDFVVGGLERRLLDSRLSDLHCGYRAFRVPALVRLPFAHNADDQRFDLEIVIQLLQRGLRIVEVPVAGHAGSGVSAWTGLVRSPGYLGVILRYRANRIYLVYHPKFDVEGERPEYVFKTARNSLHQHVARRELTEGTRVIDLGCGHGRLAEALASRGSRVWAVDRARPERALEFPFVELDLDEPFASRLLRETGPDRVNLVVALDVLEHLKRPESGLAEIHELLPPGGKLLASTGNVGYLAIRGMLALGQFNYGKRGILDLTHRRLFTIRSFRRMLESGGFRVDGVRGFGPPIEDMVGRGPLLRAVDRLSGWMARLWPTFFAYQFLVEATRREALEDIVAGMSEEKPGGGSRVDGAA